MKKTSFSITLIPTLILIFTVCFISINTASSTSPRTGCYEPETIFIQQSSSSGTAEETTQYADYNENIITEADEQTGNPEDKEEIITEAEEQVGSPEETVIEETEPETEPEPENPAPAKPYIDYGYYESKKIDFDYYKSVNNEVYAYICIPGTNIDYPVLRSGVDDLHYLDYNWKNEASRKGAIFTQSINSKSFTDPVTLMYGHHTSSDDIFSQLLKFADKAFFDTYEYFFVYLPGKVMKYRIVSAHYFDNRHIMNTYDFSNRSTLLDYEQTIQNPPYKTQNVRQGITLDENSNILTLSTCTTPVRGGDYRYLVNAVLVDTIN